MHSEFKTSEYLTPQLVLINNFYELCALSNIQNQELNLPQRIS